MLCLTSVLRTLARRLIFIQLTIYKFNNFPRYEHSYNVYLFICVSIGFVIGPLSVTTRI